MNITLEQKNLTQFEFKYKNDIFTIYSKIQNFRYKTFLLLPHINMYRIPIVQTKT